MNTCIQASQLTKRFGSEEIIKGIDLTVGESTFTAILGPSGSGKSTLLNLLSGLLAPTTGRVTVAGAEITALKERQQANWKRQSAGYVFQEYLLLANLTAAENIKIGTVPGQPHLSFDRLVRLLDLEPVLHKFPHQLSGGQKQRVAVARAVIKKPAVLFCDEATGALDEANSKQVVALLHQLKDTFGITVLFTTHNQQIARTADRILTIKDGLLFADETNACPITAAEMEWR